MASQAVYHALKAPSDPPQPGGHLKIHIASTAWDNKSLYMPNKGEVIGEWVLTKLLKDRANPPYVSRSNLYHPLIPEQLDELHPGPTILDLAFQDPLGRGPNQVC